MPSGIRGQSEVLGFILVFAIMISTIGIVYVTGYEGLRHTRDVEQVNNAQNAFEVFATNVEDMTFRNAPRRATEIKLNQASLSVSEPIEINVTDPDGTLNRTINPRPIVYESGAGKVVYEQGGVLRQQGDTDDGVVIHESTVLMSKDQTVLPLIQTRLASNSKASQGRSVTVLIRTVEVETTVVYTNATTGNTVWLNITSPRAGAWNQYLDDKPDVTCSHPTTDKTECSVTTDQVYVSLIKIDVEIA